MRIWLAVSLGVMVLCLCGACRSAEVKGASCRGFDDVMAAYNAAAYQQLAPLMNAEPLAPAQAVKRLTPVVEEYLVPHRAVLQGEVRRLLDNLPEFDLGPREQWVSALPQGKESEDLEALLGAAWGAEYPNGAPEAMKLAQMWNPIQVAFQARILIISRNVSTREFSNRMIANVLAPPLVRAVSKDVDKPVLAVITGEEVVVVSFAHDPMGYYRPVKGEWLRRKKIQ